MHTSLPHEAPQESAGTLWSRIRFCLSPTAWAWILLGLSFGVLYFKLSVAGEEVIRSSWFEGDTLFPVHVSQDVAVNGYKLTDWSFPPAPNFFPDIVLAFAFTGLTTNAALVNFLIGVVFVAGLCLSFIFCGRVTGLGTPWVRAGGILGAGIVYTLFTTKRLESYTRILFLPAYHTGTYVVSIALAALVLALYRDRMTKTQRAVGISLLVLASGLCSFGDVLLLVLLTVPLTVASVLGWGLKLISFKRMTVPLAGLWAGTGGGIAAGKLLLKTTTSSIYTRISWENIRQAAKTLYECVANQVAIGDPVHWLALLWLVICAGYVGFVFYRRNRLNEYTDTEKESLGIFTILMAFFGFSSLAMVGALVVGCHVHLTIDPWYYFVTHYMHPTLFTPLFGLPLFAGTILPKEFLRRNFEPAAGSLGVVAAAGLVLLMARYDLGATAPHRYQPTLVQNLDEIAKKYNLRNGVAGYWKAREINVFSRQKLKVCHFGTHMSYYDWIHNPQWLANSQPGSNEPLAFDFLIIDPLDTATRELAIARFGPPAIELPVDDYSKSYTYRSPAPNPRHPITVFIYNRPQDVAFRQIFGTYH